MPFISTTFKYTGTTSTGMVEKIKNGDKQLKEKFIEDYIPFILKVISGFRSSNVFDLKSSDEFSVALMAFDEAIEKYDTSKNSRFDKFAEMVIKRRLIDYFRKVSSISKNEIPFSYFSSKSESELEESLYMFNVGWESSKYELFYELKDFSEKLEAFGLNIRNLPDYMPKHKDSKQMCIRIAEKIIENKIIYDRLKTKRYFHMKELTKVIDVHPRTVERNREFIICLCIVMENNYRNFRAYLNKIF